MTVVIKNLAQRVDFLTKCHSNQDCHSICTGTVVKSSKNSINLTFHRLPIFDWQCVVVHGWLLLDNILWYVEVFSYKHLPLHSWWLENREEITQLVLCLCVFFLGENCLMRELRKLWKKYPYSPASSESKNQMNMWQVVAGHFNVLLWY